MPTTAYSPDEQSLDALFAAHEHLAADLATPDRALQRAEALTQSTGSRRRALTAAVVAGATLASGAAIQLSRSPGDPSVAAPVTADATDIAAARAAAEREARDAQLAHATMEDFEATLGQPPQLVVREGWTRFASLSSPDPEEQDRLKSGVRLSSAQPLSTESTTGEVVFLDGSREVIPVMPPAEALVAMNASDGGCEQGCVDLDVTSMTLSTWPQSTASGVITVPAWSATFADSDAEVLLMAVPDTAIVVAASGSAPREGLTQLVDWSISADGRTLTLRASGGSSTCPIEYGPAVVAIAEGERAVAIAIRATSTSTSTSTSDAGQPCTADTGISPPIATVELTQPLGSRIVLDVATNSPAVVW